MHVLMPGARAASHVPESVPHDQAANHSSIEQDFLQFFLLLFQNQRKCPQIVASLRVYWRTVVL